LQYNKQLLDSCTNTIENNCSPFFHGSVTDKSSNVLGIKNNELAGYSRDDWMSFINTNGVDQFNVLKTFTYDPFTQELKSSNDMCIQFNGTSSQAQLKTCDGSKNQRWKLTNSNIKSIVSPSHCLTAIGQINDCKDLASKLVLTESSRPLIRDDTRWD
jgi:hypothetical protein